MELERWDLILHLLISLDPIDAFVSRNLQVKALTEPLHFNVILTKFDHLEAPHELFGVSNAPGRSFQRERCTLGALMGHYEHPGHSFCSVKCALALFGWFFDGGEV